MKKLLFSAIALTTTVVSAFAQTPRVPDSGQLLRQNAQQSQKPAPIAPKAEEIPVPSQPTEVAPDRGTKIEVSGFVFDGNTVVTTDSLNQLCAAYAGHSLSLADLNGVASMVTNYYRSLGFFLAQAYIPPQNTKNGGTVKIAIVEGVLESVKAVTKPEKTRVPRRLIEHYVAQVPTGVPATNTSFNELSSKVNELPALSSRVVLEAGSTLGAAKANLEVVEGDPCKFSVDGDNYGSYATGYYRVGARMALFSPLHLGDKFDLHLQSSTTGNTQIANANYSMPVGLTGMTSGLSYSYVQYKLGESYRALDAKGDAHNVLLNLNFPALRTQKVSIDLTGALEGKALDDRMDAFNTANKRNAADLQFGATIVVQDSLFGGASSSLSLTGLAGSLDIRDASTRANDIPPKGYGLDGGYEKLLFSVSRNQVIAKGVTLFGYVSGQLASDNLDSSEQLSLGGPYGVRAYPTQEAMCDEGFVSSLELRYSMQGMLHIPGQLQFGVFIDHAEGRLRANPGLVPSAGAQENNRHLTGVGFEIDWSDADSYMVKTSIAWRTSGQPEVVNNIGDQPTVYVQVIKGF